VDGMVSLSVSLSSLSQCPLRDHLPVSCAVKMLWLFGDESLAQSHR
jgi:hypothetical protein